MDLFTQAALNSVWPAKSLVNHQELTDLAEYWGMADDHLLRAYEIAKALTAPANFFVHDLTDVNKQLKRGRPGAKPLFRPPQGVTPRKR